MGQLLPMFNGEDVFTSDTEGSARARRCAEILIVHTERLGYKRSQIEVVGRDDEDGPELERWRVTVERIK